MRERLNYIDIARGICIILVVMGHFTPTDTPGWYVRFIDIIYCFHMPLFMFISGFVYQTYQKPISYKKFIAKKFNRLMVPYFLVSVLIICIKLITGKGMYLQNPVSLSSFYEMFYSPTAGFFLWFIYVLFLIFLIIPFFNSEKKINLLLFISLILYLLPVEITTLFCLKYFKSYLFYFVLGCFMAQHKRITSGIGKVPLIATVSLFALLYVLRDLSYSHFHYATTLITLCLALCGITFIIHISKWIDLKTTSLKAFFMQMSLYSFTIYLFHTTFQGFIKSILIKLSLTEWVAWINPIILFTITVLTVYLAGIIGPIILYHIDEKGRTIIRKKLNKQTN
ncbi:acyltransferase [Parabacteroides sp. OttesenSCG-928-J18]|nr:acyltransferase [Parabacteroides sp. OttesenSCG-928-J18]